MEDDDPDDMEVRGIGGESLAGFSSLQKYRPCNYEFGPAPKESDDINDLRDYYTNLNTRQRAMQRVVSVGNDTYGNNDYGGYNNFGAGRRRSVQMSGSRTSHMKYEEDDDLIMAMRELNQRRKDLRITFEEFISVWMLGKIKRRKADVKRCESKREELKI